MKGTVCVILSNPPFIEVHIRFTTVPYTPLSGHLDDYSSTSQKFKSTVVNRTCHSTNEGLLDIMSTVAFNGLDIFLTK